MTTKRPAPKSVAIPVGNVVLDGVTIEWNFTLPPIKSSANNRENRFAKSKRVKLQRDGAYYAACAAKVPRHGFTGSVTLVRYGWQPMDDDNLAYAFKACRDGIAKALGIDDGDKRVEWLYEQYKGKPAVVVTVSRLQNQAVTNV